MANWSQIKDLDSLKKIGSFQEVKKMLSQDIQIKITAASWEILLSKIRALQKKFNPDKFAVSTIEDSNSSLSYFRSETEKAIFILVETDGRCRQKLLNITPTHYGDPKLARQWMKNLAKLVHPDITNHPKAKEAMSNLDQIYKEMLGE
ncbi:hypothetical protein [Laspinema olomoucense]|uniref:hypothetical protein n=1 Tax=Laspinema olomoucense TaxID=3231600 RepID=UPI0021BB819B|nr:hypothetical protein [Laspinema sp. D3d]MCT7973984.1 hypothetical protein [Laspinema sp. D3d]